MNIEKPLPDNSVKCIIGVFADTISTYIRELDTYIIKRVYGLGSNGCVFLVKNQADNQYCAMKCVNLSYYIIKRFGLPNTQIHAEIYNMFDRLSEQITSSRYQIIEHPHEIINGFGCIAEKNSFFREFKALKRLSPVCKTAYLLDYGYFDIKSYDKNTFSYKIPYIVMPLIRGKTLTSYIEMNLSPLERLNIVLDWTKEIIEIISSIHERGVIHRDLYSNNLIINADTGHINLIDFGASITLEHKELDTPGERRGARRFMSPEQYQNPNQVDFRSDYFFIGSLIFYSLTKQTPFNRSRNDFTLPARFNEIYKNEVPLSKGAVESLGNFIDTLSEYSPEKRFQTIEEIRDAFNATESILKKEI